MNLNLMIEDKKEQRLTSSLLEVKSSFRREYLPEEMWKMGFNYLGKHMGLYEFEKNYSLYFFIRIGLRLRLYMKFRI